MDNQSQYHVPGELAEATEELQAIMEAIRELVMADRREKYPPLSKRLHAAQARYREACDKYFSSR